MTENFTALKKLLSFLLFLICSSGIFAQTNTSTGALWNVPGNWSLGHVPLPAEDVVINTNMAMNMPAGAFTINSLTVNSGFTLTIGNSTTAQTIVVTNDVTTLGTGVITLGAFDAIHSLTVGGILSNAGTFTMWLTAARVCNVIHNGTSITGNGAYTLNNIVINGAVTNNSTSTINTRGDLTLNNSFTCTAGTISFMGAVAQNVNGTTNPTFNNLDLRTAGTAVTVGGSLSNITVTGALTMNGGGTPSLNLGTTLSAFSVGGNFTMANGATTFNFGTTVGKTVTITGNLVTPQTITMTGAGLAHQLILSGAANAAPVTFNTTAGSGSIVEYNNAASQTVFTSANYRNVRLSGSGTKTFSGATTVNNDLTITGSGILVSNANALTVSGNVTASGSGTTTWGGAANTTNITGNLLVTNNTTFTLGSQAANKTINVTGNVQVDAGSTINVGAFNATHVITIGGNLINDGTLDLWLTNAQVCNVAINGTSITGNGSYTFNSLTIGGTVTNNSTSTINIRANLTLNNSFTSPAGLLNFNGTAAQTISGTATATVNDVTFTGASTKTWGGNASTINVNGNLLVTGSATFTIGNTVGQPKTLSVAGNAQIDVGSVLNIGAFDAAHSFTLGGTLTNAGTLTLWLSAVRVCNTIMNGTLITSNGAYTFNNLTINGALTSVVASTVNIRGNLTVNNNTTWGGNANTTNIFGNLLVTNNSAFTLGNTSAEAKTVSITGNVQVDAGSAVSVGAFAATHAMTISGNLLSDGTFNMVQTFPTNVCNVTFAGATSNTITGAGTINFNQITVTKGAIANVLDVLVPITMSAPTAAGNFLTITSGTFRLSSATTLTPYFGVVTICGGTGNLWLNHAGAIVSSVGTAVSASPGNATVTGTIRLTSGTINYGSGDDVMAFNAATSNLIMEGGTLNMFGGMSFTSTSQFNMTTGNINIYPQAFDNLNATVLNLASTNVTSAVSFTGGTLTIVDPPANAVTTFNLTNAGVYNFAGSTIRFGDGSSNVNGLAGTGFRIAGGSTHGLGTVLLNNGTSTGTNRFIQLVTNSLVVNGSLTIGNNSNDNFFLNGQLLRLNGTLTVGTGTLVGSATSSLAIGGNNTPVMNLPPIVGGNLLNLIINKTGTNNTVSLGNAITLAAGGVLTLTSGILELGNFNLQLLNSGAAAIAGAPFSAGNMVSINGTGYLIKNANSTQALSPVGSGGFYTPMTLTSIAPNTGTYSVRPVPAALNPRYINIYWDFRTSLANKTITATFQYDPTQLNGASEVIAYLPDPYTIAQSPPLSGTSSFGTNSFTITGNTTTTNGGYWTMGGNRTYYSFQTGNWDVPTTWTSDPSGTLQIGSTIPEFNDNAVILPGRTVSITGNITTQALKVTINTSGFLDMATFSFTSGLATLAGEGTLRLASVNFPTVTTNTLVNAGGGTVEYYNSSSFTLPVAQTIYNNLNINSPGQVATQVNNLTLNGNLWVRNGTFQINDNTSARRQLLISGNVTVNSGASIAVGNGVTNTVTDPTSVAATAGGPFIGYYDNHSHRVVINGDLINNGTVNFSNIIFPIYDAFPPTVLDPTSGFATVYFRGSANNVLTCNGPTNFYNLVLDKGSDQTFSLTVNSSAYSNFKMLGANNAAADITGATATNPNIKKALWIRNGTFVLQGSTIIPSLTEGNITAALPATSDFYIPANGALTINGPDVVVLTTADDYREVNTAYGVSGGTGLVNGVIQGGFSSLYVYGRLQVSNGYLSTRESGGIITNGGSGQVVINGGDVDAKQFLNATGSTASFQMTGGLFALRGRFQRTPASYASVANLVDNTASTINTARALNGTTTGFGTFNLNNPANIFTMSGGDIWVYDVCDDAPPATAPFAFDVKSQAANINVTGGTLTIIPTTGTVLADEASYDISSTAPLGNLVIDRVSGTALVRLNTGFPLTVLSNVTIQSGVLDANAQNLTIGGNFSIANGTSYLATGASANTTTFNGSGIQTFTINTAAPLDVASLTLTKTAGVAVNLAGTQNTLNVLGNLTITLGTLNDSGKNIFVAGNVFNSGLHTGAGKISLNGSASTQTIDGNGIFQNLELNNTNAATAPISLINNVTINGALTFAQDKLFNIGIHNLRFNASATVVNAGPLRYAVAAGNAGDGGITKVYSSTASFVFPIGAESTSRVGTPAYTPATIGFGTAPTTYGSITVRPVGYAHPNATTPGRSLSYFWRVTSSGFTLGSGTVTHGYTYAAGDVITGAGITENEYVAARYNVATTTWSKGTTSDLNIVGKIIGEPGAGSFLENVNFIDGDYTAGDDNPIDPFGTPKTFYSFATGVWGSAANWTTNPDHVTYDNPSSLIPGAGDIVVIGNNHTISMGTPVNYLTVPNTDPRSCATLIIKSGATLDVRFNPASNFGIVQSHSGGNGTIRITTAQASGSTFANPLGDFSDFNVNLGTTELYSTNPAAGTTYWLRNGVTTYGNLIISPLGGSNIIFPNNDLTIFGDCTTNGQNADSWFCPTWLSNYPLAPTVPVAKTITIQGNLNIVGGAFYWMAPPGGASQDVVVNGNVTVGTLSAINTFGAVNPRSLTIGGSLINNANGLVNAPASTLATCNFTSVPLIFSGSNSASVTNSVGTPSTTFGTVTVNKGNSQATTLTIDIAGTLTTPANNWLNLQNGTLRYMRTDPATNFNISTTTNFTIPSTAGLYIDYANANNVNVLIANSGADASDMLLSGKLTVVRGNIYVGPVAATAFNNDIEYSGTSAALQVDGGNLFVNGQIRRSTASTNGSLSYIQNGGDVRINGQSSAGGLAVAQTRAKLEVVNTGSQFNMSGGTLTIVRGGGTTFGDLFIRPSSSVVTGGTIVFSNVIPNNIQNYSMDADTPLNNLTITGAAGFNANVSLTTNPLVLNGSLTLTNVRSFLNSNSRDVTIRQDLINNAAPANYNFGTNLTTFSGSTQNISGTSVTNFYDLNVSPSVSLTVNNSFTVNRNLTISSGSLFLNTNLVSVLTNGSFVNNGAYTDDNITGGVRLGGTVQQQVSGTGSFNRLEINNTSGALLLNDITLDHDLVMTNGVFNIQSNNLILNTGATIGGSGFGTSKMIMTDGVATSAGLRKFFPTIGSTTNFTFPLGVTSKYTPAELTINANGGIGYINVSPVDAYQPTVIDPSKVLHYYFNIASSGIFGFDGNLVLNYLQSDVNGSEPDYVAARLELPGTFWSKAAPGPGTDNVDETTNEITFSFPPGTNNLNGDYTAGEDPAIPAEVPTYISNSNGNWSDNTIWTPVGSSPPCPPGGPNGFNVILQHNVVTDVNYCFAYTTVIRGTGRLSVVSPTFGHNFGTVSGDPSFGTGTLYLETGNLPAGNFSSFMDCAGDGTVEYGGSGSYTLVLSTFTTIPNLRFTGSGTRILPNQDLTICNRLVIDGPTLDNSVSNRKLTINGSMERYTTGAFVSGSGANATVTFAGSAAQSVGGPTGDFAGANAFNNLEINNAAGLVIGANGNIEVNRNLLLTNGIITTTMVNQLSILNNSNAAVVPTGGSTTSYISGPLKKQIVNGDIFVFPLGKGVVRAHTFTLMSTSAGTSLFTGEFFTPNPAVSVTAPLVVINRQEYWAVTATAPKTARVELAWDALSDLNGTMTQNGLTDLQVAEYNPGPSSWVGQASTTFGINSVGSARTTGNVNLSATAKNYTIGSLTTTSPLATLSPSGPVCGTSGIPVTFTTHTIITLTYTISYNYNGVPQTPIVVTGLPFSLPTPSPGTYQLTGFTYDNSTLVGVVDPTIITTYAAPTTANAGPNQSLCNQTSLNLQGNQPVVGTGLWTIVSGTGGWFNVPDATNYNALFGGPPGQTYTLRWTITNGLCTSSSTVVISFPFAPVQPSAFTAAPVTVCQGTSGYVYTVPPVAGATSYVWSYSGAGATIIGSGNSVIVNYGIASTSGNLSVSAVNGCGPGAPRTVAITVGPPPTFSSWTGVLSSDWFNPGNWNCNTIPTSIFDAVISSGAPNMPVVNSAGAVCKSITINVGATFTINGTNNLSVHGDWVNNGTFLPNSSTVTFHSTASIGGTATTTYHNVSIAATGNVTTSSSINVSGNWTNLGTFSASAGTVTFNGSAAQSMSGSNSFSGLAVNKATGNVTLAGTGSTTVTSDLNLSNGHISSSTVNTLALGSSTVTGGSANSFISGPITKTLAMAGSFAAPLGSIAANRYRPATISNTSGADSWNLEYVGASPTTGGYSANSFNTSSLGKISGFEYWLISRAGSTSADVELSYGPGSYIGPNIGVLASLRVARWDASFLPSGQWDLPPVILPSTNGHFSGDDVSGSVRVTNVSAFSPLTLGSLDTSSPLPVTLISFTGRAIVNGIELLWTTASEINNDYFDVEKLIDPENFESIGRINGRGTTNQLTNYRFVDEYPEPGISYYRLKQTDLNGDFAYSKIIGVEYKGDGISIAIYPNPARSEEVNLVIRGLTELETLPVLLHDPVGREVLAENLKVNKAQGVIQATISIKDLPNGIYFLKLGGANGPVKKLVVSK